MLFLKKACFKHSSIRSLVFSKQFISFYNQNKLRILFNITLSFLTKSSYSPSQEPNNIIHSPLSMFFKLFRSGFEWIRVAVSADCKHVFSVLLDWFWFDLILNNQISPLFEKYQALNWRLGHSVDRLTSDLIVF
jgi:hypothetical protein